MHIKKNFKKGKEAAQFVLIGQLHLPEQIQYSTTHFIGHKTNARPDCRMSHQHLYTFIL